MTAIGLVVTAPAVALDMPTRKAGLWEVKMIFEGRNLPATTMRQCIDAATDKKMNANFGGSALAECSKQDMQNSGGVITVDSVCTFGADHHHLACGRHRQFRQRLYDEGRLDADRAARRCRAPRRAPRPT